MPSVLVAVRHVGLSSALALCAAACARSEPGSCVTDGANQCIQYTSATAAAGKRMCAGGVWRGGPGTCPADGALGACLREHGAFVETRYSGPPNNYSAAGARRACEIAGGAWREP